MNAGPHDEPCPPTRLPLATHANLHFVTPTLAVGGDLDTGRPSLAADQIVDLHRLGITHVVDCRLERSDEPLVTAALPGVRYLHHGMDDDGRRVAASWFETAVSWIEAAGPDAVVLTHCHAGINRGPSLGFAVLLHQGWDAVDAIAAIRAVRPQAHVWYACDALVWHHDRHGTDPHDDLLRLAAWRAEHPLELVRQLWGQAQQD